MKRGFVGESWSVPFNEGKLYAIASLIPRISSPARCLNIGCGEGIIAEVIKRKGYLYYGLDLSKGILRRARCSLGNNNIFVQVDANYLPFKRCCFDLVIALEIIEHVDNPCKLLKEADSVLINGGYLIISTPNKISLEGIKGKIKSLS